MSQECTIPYQIFIISEHFSRVTPDVSQLPVETFTCGEKHLHHHPRLLLHSSCQFAGREGSVSTLTRCSLWGHTCMTSAKFSDFRQVPSLVTYLITQPPLLMSAFGAPPISPFHPLWTSYVSVPYPQFATSASGFLPCRNPFTPYNHQIVRATSRKRALHFEMDFNPSSNQPMAGLVGSL